MKNVITLLCLLATVVASAQFTESGFYRVRNASTQGYVCINGTKFLKSTLPDAFWPCIKMNTDSSQVTDPGSVIFIDHIGEDCDLCSQGVSTYTLTHLMMTVDSATTNEGGIQTYVAKTYYEYMVDSQLVALDCMFRDMGWGLQAGNKEKKYSHWWIEPLSEASMDYSYFGVKPQDGNVVDADGWYWTSLCCDFPVAIPVDGGVWGAYTVTTVERGDDGCYYAEPLLLYEQGDTVPAATPVLIKCKYEYASGNKLIPVGKIANNTSFPIKSEMLRGNYFAPFSNHSNLSDQNEFAMYYPSQATLATSTDLALGVDQDGRVGFFPQESGTYMAANTAWLSTATISETRSLTCVYLGPEQEPEEEIIHGDANGDGVVNVTDITTLIDYLLGSKTVQYSDSMDVDGNGVVNITDIAHLIDMILTSGRR